MINDLTLALQICGWLQLFICCLNLFLPAIMRWHEDLNRLPLLIKEVFFVHSWFISLLTAIFASMTLKFGQEMFNGSNLACTYLAAMIGAFWLFRTILQVTYYSSSHWRGNRRRTLIHIACLLVYGGVSSTYIFAAIQGGIIR
jgi:hypothetical protein